MSGLDFEIVVVGGGHAGAEAAHAAAALGARTALVTMQREAIGRMSCNPAIGGLGKGQIVREIDALGGLMARVIDPTGLQFRMLNLRKGPAVWAPRAQADRELYADQLRRMLENTPHLSIIEGLVDGIIVESGTVKGVALDDNRRLRARAVVLTTGTFLRALMHCGPIQTPGGRVGEQSADRLSDSLKALGLELGRLKTGTPPRVHRDSIDYDGLAVQPGDEPPVPFSYVTDEITQRQIDCWVTYTNRTTHDIIRHNLHVAPLFSGQISSTGPRYCPSIEDKIVRFADKDRHQIFLEPEGYDDERIYCNGISTSLPADVQEQLVHSVAGLEKARILQPGYAIEYDWVPTHQIDATLETKRISGLFLAGQINGTSGYEEAAAQGLIAGVNAVAGLFDREPVVLRRDQAYIGVMIDDLVTRPPTEPYRMFTSRAEYRLHLRSDNADERLTPIGRRVGLVDDARWQRFERLRDEMGKLEDTLAGQQINGCSAIEWLRRPQTTLRQLRGTCPELATVAPDGEAARRVEIRTKYAGYVNRQQREIEKFQRLESMPVPAHIDYASIPALRAEAREKLTMFMPRTLGQAGRISGITPSDITVLWLYLRHK